VADVESLVLATSTFGRLDPRLFDEVLDWLHTNGELVATQRLRRLMKQHGFAGGGVLSAIGQYLSQTDRSPRWKQVIRPPTQAGPKQPLFLLGGTSAPSWGDGDPVFGSAGYHRGIVHLRGMSTAFDPSDPACLQVRLRCLMGTNVRADLLVFLVTHGSGAHPSLVARRIGYAQSATHTAMATMARSGAIRRRDEGRQQVYSLTPAFREACVYHMQTPPRWWPWAHFYRLAEAVWLTLTDDTFGTIPQMVQAAELRKVVEGPMLGLGDVDPGPLAELESSRTARQHPEAYVEAVCELVGYLLDATSEPAVGP